MNDKLAHLVTCLYPRSWRERYGDEFEALLMAESTSVRTLTNIVRSALKERVVVAHISEGQLLTSFRVIIRNRAQ